MSKLFLLAALALVGCAVAQIQYRPPFGQNRFNSYYGGANNRFGLGNQYYNGLDYNNQYTNQGFYNGGAFDPYYNGQYRQQQPFGFNRRFPAVAPAVSPIRPFAVRPIAPLVGSTAEAGARIVSQTSDATPDGAYQYRYATENGIQAEEVNQPQVISNGQETVVVNNVQGSYSYTAPNGEQIAVTYTADENGFRPVLHGDAAVGPAAASVRHAGPVAVAAKK